MQTTQLDPDQLLEVVLGHLSGLRRASWGYQAKCPAHEDRVQSLAVTKGEQCILVKCHAGCLFPEIVAAMGMKPSELFYASEIRNGASMRQVVATYPYTDEAGTVLYEVLRYEPKGFSQRLADGSTPLGKVRRVPYHLPRLVAAKRVWFCEGEKDVAALEAAGVVATCIAGGAAAWRKEYPAFFAGKVVTIVVDQDNPGRKFAAVVEAALRPLTARLRLVRPFVGKDASDHLGTGYTLNQFVEQEAFCRSCGEVA